MYFYKALFTTYQKSTDLIECKYFKIVWPLRKFYVISNIAATVDDRTLDEASNISYDGQRTWKKMCAMSLECLLYE